jgi:hypothetical protein
MVGWVLYANDPDQLFDPPPKKPGEMLGTVPLNKTFVLYKNVDGQQKKNLPSGTDSTMLRSSDKEMVDED